MEFSDKLQELRKQKGLTQEELAQILYVSRTAVSKWESGRGYPNIESMKAIAKLYAVSIDDLLSGEELLTVAEAEHKEKTKRILKIVYCLLDLSAILFLFMPFFGQETNGRVLQVSLLHLTKVPLWLHIFYFVVVCFTEMSGVLFLILTRGNDHFWSRHKFKLSLLLNVFGTFLFIICRQVYAAIFLFLFLLIKAILFPKTQ